MPTKFTDAEKAIDSAIRAFNKQIENAYTKLGYDHTITRNLVSTARSIFGKDAVRTMSTKYIDKKNIDYSTGEYHETIQVKRSKTVIQNAIKNGHIEMLNKATRFKNTTNNRDLDKYNGEYKSLYNVSQAYQKAIEQVRQYHTANLPQNVLDSMSGKSIAEKDKILEAYLKLSLTDDNINMQLFYNDLSTEIFAAYNQERSEMDDDDDYTETFLKMQEFANSYNSGDYNLALLFDARKARDNYLFSQQYKNDIEYAQGLNFSDFEDLNIF